MSSRQRDGQHGATSTEYLLVLVLVAIVIVGGAYAYGTTLADRFSVAGSDVGAAVD